MRIAVIGAGVTGLATTYALRQQGQDAWCYESGVPMGARSVGDTRIFRLAHDRPELVRWAEQSRTLWDGWSQQAGRPLIGPEGVVVSGEISSISAAMATAAVPFDVTDTAPDVPGADPQGPFLIDPSGGVIQAAATGRFLLGKVGTVVREPITSITVDAVTARIVSPSRTEVFDSVVITAGAGTATLAAQVSIGMPLQRSHHVRFTFPLRDSRRVHPCWMDRSHQWRPGFTTYGLCPRPGFWAVGGNLPDAEVGEDLDPSEAVERSRQAVTAYVNEQLTGLAPYDPATIESVYGDYVAGLSDGLVAERNGPVLAVSGGNLFKFAPAIGIALARSAVDLNVSSELDEVLIPSSTWDPSSP